jgi:predicted membrane channel-forming protein YqfA (hemolysin III family)
MIDHACISLVVSYSWAIVGALYMTQTSFIYVVPAVNTLLFCYTAFIDSTYKVYTYFVNSIVVLSYSYIFFQYLTIFEIVLISATYIQYLIGLYIYNTKILDLYPSVLGHHEIFHLFTIGAFITTFITNLSLVIRN